MKYTVTYDRNGRDAEVVIHGSAHTFDQGRLEISSETSDDPYKADPSGLAFVLPERLLIHIRLGEFHVEQEPAAITVTVIEEPKDDTELLQLRADQTQRLKGEQDKTEDEELAFIQGERDES